MRLHLGESKNSLTNCSRGRKKQQKDGVVNGDPAVDTGTGKFAPYSFISGLQITLLSTQG